MQVAKSYVIPVWFLLITWVVFIIDLFLPLDLAIYGIYPRTVHGLAGILFAPLIHGNILHLISNTMPMLFLGIILYIFYGRIANKVFFQGYFYTNILVWFFGRPSYHIGASGLIYCIASFLAFYGIFKKDFKSIAISVAIIFLYGGLFYGVLSTQPGVSWESHLMGGIVGFILASGLSKS
jgi:membrane associated rhomboid family serine protease